MPRHDPVPPRVRPQAIANRHAWARFRRIMAWMTVLAIACVAASLAWLASTGPLRLHMVIAVVLGVFLTVMVATALMSLVFLSAGSGHDAEVASFERD